MNPAFRFRVYRGVKLRAVGDLQRSRTNAAAAIHTPANHPARDHFATGFRTFQGGKAKESPGFAKAGNRAAYKQFPCEARGRTK